MQDISKLIAKPLCHARIDTSALRHNYAVLKQAADGKKLLLMVKANAYGHGLLNVANTLGSEMNEQDAFGVARMSEAVQLRKSGIKNRVVVLSGAMSFNDWQLAQHLDIDLAVHNSEQLQSLQDFCTGLNEGEKCGFGIWLKIDTGMHRLGFLMKQVPQLISVIEGLEKYFAKPLVVMSHFANADDIDDPFNSAQESAFKSVQQAFEESEVNKLEFSLPNSGALLSRPNLESAWMRPGIALYGISPFYPEHNSAAELKAVMSLETQLISIKTLEIGEGVGYGQTWHAVKPTRIGIAAIGYGDGYPRELPSGTQVIVEGKLCKLIGTVSMDLIAIDLSNAELADIGARVQVWGDELSVTEIAHAAKTIAYTLVCGITQRVAVELL